MVDHPLFLKSAEVRTENVLTACWDYVFSLKFPEGFVGANTR